MRNAATVYERLVIGILLVAVTVVARLLPHPPNFAPVAAVALFAGYFFADRRLAVIIPILGMVLSDAIIGVYDLRIMLAVYVGLSLPVLLSRWVGGSYWALRLASTSLAGSAIFYLVSNFAVWAFAPFYPLTASGMFECYVAAVPFFKLTVAGDLFWNFAIFGTYSVYTSLSFASTRRTATALPPA